MEKMTDLEKRAIIYRKYNLGDYSDFKVNLSKENNENLKLAWEFAFKKIQNSEIIKDGTELSFRHLNGVQQKIKEFQDKDLFFYLNDSNDITKLQLDEEKIERRFRNYLAKKYIESFETKKVQRKEKIKVYFKLLLLAILIIVVFNLKTIKNGLTPISTLTEQIHENSKRKYNGAICNDGSISRSQGRGTCSHHGGVRYYFYKGEYSKSYKECLIEAKLKSWWNE